MSSDANKDNRSLPDSSQEALQTDDTFKELTPTTLIANLKAAAKTARDTKDYITYSTLLDVYLERAYKEFSDEDKDLVLTALLEVLNSEDELVYAISWDIPRTVLPFLQSSTYDFGIEILSQTPCLKIVMEIFKVLAEKGNLKELVVKCLENLDKLQFVPLAEDDNRPDVVVERFFELKFAALYGLLVNSIKNVKARYPSRFLIAATTSLLSFLVDRVETFSLRTTLFVLRRYYLFIRDYNPVSPDDGDVSEQETVLQDKILKKFLIDTFALGLQAQSVKWGQKLLIQLRKGVAFDADAEKRDAAYHTGQYNVEFAELIQKLCQLADTLKIDANSEFKSFVDKIVKESDESEGDNKIIIEDNVNSDDNWDLDNDFEEPDSFHYEGIFIFATAKRFNDRQNPSILKLSFPELIKVTKYFIVDSDQDLGEGSKGLYDALSFWALWTTRTLTSEQVQTLVSKDELISYVQMLMYIAEATDEESQEQLLFSIIARLLSLHKIEIRIEFLLDTAEFCPYPKVREATIKLLAQALAKKEIKLNVIKKNSSESEGLAESVSKLSIDDGKSPAYVFTDAHISRISNAALEQLNEIESLGTEGEGALAGLLSPDFKVLLSLICFIAVISKSISDESVLRSTEITERCLKYLSTFDTLLASMKQSNKDFHNEDDEEIKKAETRKQLLVTTLAGLKSEKVNTATK